MIETTAENRSDIVKELKRKNGSTSRLVIGIDGNKGSGKTNLAHYVASELMVNALHLDHFLVTGLNCYVKALNFGLLMQQVQLEKGRTFIVEGCCLLDVAKMLNLQLDALIYCKEISRDTKIWHYGNNFDEYATSNYGIGLSDLDRELLEYHRQLHPWEQAKFIYYFFNDLKVQ